MTASPRVTARHPDDAGGVWIVTGLVLGAVVYAGMVMMLVAGFTPVTPLVVIPPVLVALIGGNNLVGGGRGHRRSARPSGPDPAPPPVGAPNGSRPAGSAVPAEESGDSR